MGLGIMPGGQNELEGYGFQHELDDYINSFAEEDQFNLFFDDAYYNEFGEAGCPPFSLPNNCAGSSLDVPDSAIDPLLRVEPDVPGENPTVHTPSAAPNTIVAAPGLLHPQPPRDHTDQPSQTTTFCSPTRKLRRKSKRDESTHNHNSEAKYPLYDHRLYELARHNGTPFKCAPPLPTQNPGYTTIPDVEGFNEGSTPPEISQDTIDEFLASINSISLDQSLGDIIMSETPPQVGRPQTPANPSVINQQEFTLRMLAPSAPLVQPSEKRKRGRPKKDEVNESHQETSASSVPHFPSFQAPTQILMQPTSFPQPSVIPRSFFPLPQYFPQTPVTPSVSTPTSLRSTPNPVSEADDEHHLLKRRRLSIRSAPRSMSKKEQAYIEMDNKVKLYDETNIHELLYYPSIKPGRTPCFWIQRHPYANTRVYADHYRTWCRYRHCKGVETTELIRTATGEMREKNYKHPRTIIAGNYQVAVDWEYVTDEILTFKDDLEGQYEYDKRNVFDTVECFFHLRCFEQLVDFPQVVRTHLVQVDHRVLNKDKSKNKITKRKNKGGTNAAEIEWYLKEDAERWMQRTQLDWSFNPLPGSDESLEKVLLNGKKQYNEKKGSKYMFPTGSEFGSPAPSDF